MTIDEIKQKLNTSEYAFLKTNPHLGNRIIMLALSGSYAYGTNVKTSDIDIRGCALQSKAELLGMQNFEQVIDPSTDTTIYSFRKLVNLLINCNPNVIELLGNKPEHYLFLSEVGRQMVENRKMFLSQKAVPSFYGYANQQRRRLENAIARDRVPEEEKERHLLKTMKISMDRLADSCELFRDGRIRVEIPKTGEKITCSVNIDHYPLREFGTIINSLTNIAASFDKLEDRTQTKDFAHRNKHAMHLIRLYCVCLDILEKGDIFTYREKEHAMLMDIRAGKYQNPDGTYQSEYFELVNAYEKRLQYAKENTALPMEPKMKWIEEFVRNVNEKVVLMP